MNAAECQSKANDIRRKILSLTEIANDTIHWGGSFSCAEIISSLYCGVLKNTDSENFEEKDKLILSKGHAAVAVYSIMNLIGLMSDELLNTYQKDGSMISELMDYYEEYGFETSGGSLGINLSYAVGLSLLAKKKGYPYRTYVIVGDGEIDEGNVWEAVMAASQYQLDNITLIVDANTVQSDGFTKDIMSWEKLKERLEAFGWDTRSVDGHDCGQLLEAFLAPHKTGVPKAVIAETVKGKGVSFIENDYLWHDRVMKPEEIEIARKELN